MPDLPASIPLGPFELSQPVGAGGVGEVWRGVHRAQQSQVAVKVLHVPQGGRRRSLREFTGEVRAMAGLNHPNIVQIYDYGQLPRQVKPPLAPEQPFLVMEWVEGGTIREPMMAAPWGTIKRLLLTLLDALAHAHARGLIHRDLKPENVLWGGGVHAVKLTDFGLAQAMEEDLGDRVSTGTVQGTPVYMAPEQIQGQLRDFGPWTDLYALGCMAYELICGRTPYLADDPVDMMVAHLTGPTPPWRPCVPVPTGAEAWVRRMIHRQHLMRFTRAADAAWALRALQDPQEAEGEAWPSGEHPSAEALGTAPTIEIPSLVSAAAQGAERTLLEVEAVGHEITPPDVEPQPNADLPPIPEDWRRAGEQPGAHLRGVGLAVYPFRTLPLIGRVAERDALWTALRAVAREGRPQVMVLEGASGYGKSRLAEWLCEEAHHRGAATPLRATHGPLRGRGHGLGPMVARHARLQGLGPMEALARLEEAVRPLGLSSPRVWLSLGAMLFPGEAAARGVRLSSLEEVYAALEQWLVPLSRRRPVVVWLDDVQWGPEALGWVEHLLQRRSRGGQGARCPVLVVATVRSEALPQRPMARELLESLVGRPGVKQITVGPLTPDARAALLTTMLGLEGSLFEALDARTEGNPLFAVQLIGDWIRRGLLRPGPEGFVLQPGADVELPANVHEVWAARVVRALEGRPPGDAEALELAAVLGRTVDPTEWAEALAHLKTAASPDLVERLLDERLAYVEEDEGWSLIHGMLRESLERRAREGGRLPRLHRACADMLAAQATARQGAVGPRQRGREGAHRLGAGQWALAMPPLAEGVRGHLDIGAYREAQRLLDGWLRAAEALGLPEADPRWGEGWRLRCEQLRMVGRLEEAQRWALKIAEVIERPTWRAQRLVLLQSLGALAKDRGELSGAERWLRLALEEDTSLELVQVRCMEELGWVLLGQGRTEEAEEYFATALEIFEEEGEVQAAGRCMVGLSRVSKRQSHSDEALDWLQRAEVRFAQAGFRAGQAACANQRGELARLLGRMDEAESCYRLAWAGYEEVGSGNAVFPQANLALVLIERAAYGEARPLLEAALARFTAQGRAQYAGALHICLLPCLVDEAAAFDAHLAAAEATLAETGLADVDAARMATLAGRRALEAGELERGRRALELARAQWTLLGRADQVAVVDALAPAGG